MAATEEERITNLTEDERVLELARIVLDRNVRRILIAPGMEDQIRRNGLLIKKTYDGNRQYIQNIIRSKNYYRE